MGVVLEIIGRSVDGKVALVGSEGRRVNVNDVGLSSQQAGLGIVFIEQAHIQRRITVFNELVDEETDSLSLDAVAGGGDGDAHCTAALRR